MAWHNLTIVFALFACIFLLDEGVNGLHRIYPQYQNLQAVSVKDLHRTGYHFQPPKHWINDPNGPMFFNGYYHLFYQYNPKGAVWGNIVWAHSVSKDLINWEALEPAIFPSESFDANGTWSGSATILPGNKPVILYTGINSKQDQLQNYAVPKNVSDPYLREWVKPLDINPIIVPESDKSVNRSAFRDPTTAWKVRNMWHILVGGKHDMLGIAHMYLSKDFKKWVRAPKPLHTVENTGMLECPDFFTLPCESGKDILEETGEKVKHILKFSLDLTRFEYYTVGSYDHEKDIYIPDKTSVDGWDGLRFDYGNYYASKTFFDQSKNRRILLGWANESDSIDADKAKGWAGIQAIPRQLWMDKNGKQVIQWPVKELDSLREKQVEMSKKKIKKGEHFEVKGITGAQADVEVSFSFSSLEKAEKYESKWDKLPAQDVCYEKGSTKHGGLGPFGLITLASKDLEEYTPVFFRIFKHESKHKILFCSDARRSTLDKDVLYKPSYAGWVDVELKEKKLKLRSLIDHSVVESFAEGGKTVILSRVYPTLAVSNAAHLYVFNNGSETITVDSLKAWSMKNPVMNVPVKLHH
ncbi:Beta-fructofuranosidase insoluble isoenzyme 1 [Euphorbia peplus]|nr:Beta-fructofuranosidase insoluble isoenzyme 1 [Euphorbia peplus]